MNSRSFFVQIGSNDAFSDIPTENYIVLHVQKGAGRLLLTFQTVIVEAGYFYFFSPGHFVRWEGEGMAVAVAFSPEFIPGANHTLEQLFSLHHPAFGIPLTEAERPALDGLIRLMEAEQRRKIRDDAVLGALLLSLLLVCVRMRSGVVRKRNTWRQERMARIEDLIETHYKTEHYASFYAAAMDITTHYLNTLLKRHIGKTLPRLLIERIITEAKRELLHTSRSVREIAESLGYTDPSYFSRLFKREAGETPLRFRESFKKYH